MGEYVLLQKGKVVAVESCTRKFKLNRLGAEVINTRIGVSLVMMKKKKLKQKKKKDKKYPFLPLSKVSHILSPHNKLSNEEREYFCCQGSHFRLLTNICKALSEKAALCTVVTYILITVFLNTFFFIIIRRTFSLKDIISLKPHFLETF